jgi:hypothetical protein
MFVLFALPALPTIITILKNPLPQLSCSTIPLPVSLDRSSLELVSKSRSITQSSFAFQAIFGLSI